MNYIYHKSVLLQETIYLLRVSTHKRYIDATVGGGGYTKAILDLGGVVLGIDLDEDAISYCREQFSEYENITLTQGNFKDIDEIARKYGFDKVSGIVMDLGLSSHQIDDKYRGFSYLGNNALDMRMDKSSKVKALDLLNILDKDQLYEIFTKFGQEPRSRAISNSIVRARRVKAFENTADLTDIVQQAYGLRGEISMKAKAQVNNRVFQALRIAVNNELNNLAIALPAAIDLLEKGGRLVVISFHSLEDRIVKRAFLGFEKAGKAVLLTQKPIVPSFAQITDNRRAKSAKLRAIERL